MSKKVPAILCYHQQLAVMITWRAFEGDIQVLYNSEIINSLTCAQKKERKTLCMEQQQQLHHRYILSVR